MRDIFISPPPPPAYITEKTNIAGHILLRPVVDTIKSHKNLTWKKKDFLIFQCLNQQILSSSSVYRAKNSVVNFTIWIGTKG